MNHEECLDFCSCWHLLLQDLVQSSRFSICLIVVQASGQSLWNYLPWEYYSLYWTFTVIQTYKHINWSSKGAVNHNSKCHIATSTKNHNYRFALWTPLDLWVEVPSVLLVCNLRYFSIAAGPCLATDRGGCCRGLSSRAADSIRYDQSRLTSLSNPRGSSDRQLPLSHKMFNVRRLQIEFGSDWILL